MQSCGIVRKSYALKSLIYNCKCYYRTNVLFFYTCYPQEKNKYIELFHVEHNYLKINNIPDKKEEKSVRVPAPPSPDVCENRAPGRTFESTTALYLIFRGAGRMGAAGLSHINS